METARNFAMSGINSGHHNRPTYKISLKSNNVEFVRYCGGHFENGDRQKFFNVGNQIGTSLSTHKYIYYQILMISDNVEFQRYCGSHFENGDRQKIFSMSGINSGLHYLPTDQILMISDNVDFLSPFFVPCFGSHFENGRHLENFENAELLF